MYVPFRIVNVVIKQGQIRRIQPAKLEIVEHQDTSETFNVCNSLCHCVKGGKASAAALARACGLKRDLHIIPTPDMILMEASTNGRVSGWWEAWSREPVIALCIALCDQVLDSWLHWPHWPHEMETHGK